MKLGKDEYSIVSAMLANGFYSGDAGPSGKQATVSGKFIACLLLGDIEHGRLGEAQLRRLRGIGIRLKNLTIEGPVELPFGGEQNDGALLLDCENCTFLDPLVLQGWTFRRFNLRDCRVTELDADHCRFLTTVDLTNLSTAETGPGGERNGALSEGLCHLKLNHAAIEGDLIADGVTLCAPPPRQEWLDNQFRRGRHYALSARALELKGSLILLECPTAIGGITLVEARIGGSIWLTGANCIGIEGHAFYAQLARVEGGLIVREYGDPESNQPTVPSRFRGEVNLFGATFASGIYLEQVFIEHFDLSSKRQTVINFTRVRTLTVSLSGYVKGAAYLGAMDLEADLHLGNEAQRIRLLPRERQSEGALVSLAGSRIGATLRTRELAFNDTYLPFFEALASRAPLAIETRKIACYPKMSLLRVSGSDHWGEREAYLLQDEKKTYLLDGRSSVFHYINGKTGHLDLSTEQAARDYLLLFCNCLISDNGPFSLVSGKEQMGAAILEAIGDRDIGLKMWKDEKGWRATAQTVYAVGVFNCEFLIKPNGMVEMLRDQPLASCRTSIYFDAPFRRTISRSKERRVAYGLGKFFADGWSKVEDTPQWRQRCRKTLEQIVIEPRPVLDLTGASCASLDDVNGTEWGNAALLSLEGFRYDRLVQTESLIQANAIRAASTLRQLPVRFRVTRGLLQTLLLPFAMVFLALRLLFRLPRMAVRSAAGMLRKIFGRAIGNNKPPHHTLLSSSSPALDHDRRGSRRAWRYRLDWLALQYPNYVPTDSHFHPQPYAQLARAFELGGQKQNARRVLSHKFALESRFEMGRGFRPLAFLFWLGFDYGLSARRAIWTLLGCIAVGALLTAYAVRNEILVLEVAPAASVVSSSDREVGIAISNDGAIETNIPCRNAINPLLYSIDVFIPLIDLRQEMRCDIRTAEVASKGEISVVGYPVEMSVVNSPTLWGVGKAIFSIIGWIVTSLTILSCTGLVRHAGERIE